MIQFTRWIRELDYQIWYCKNGQRDAFLGFQQPAYIYLETKKAQRLDKYANILGIVFGVLAVVCIALGLYL